MISIVQMNEASLALDIFIFVRFPGVPVWFSSLLTSQRQVCTCLSVTYDLISTWEETHVLFSWKQNDFFQTFHHLYGVFHSMSPHVGAFSSSPPTHTLKGHWPLVCVLLRHDSGLLIFQQWGTAHLLLITHSWIIVKPHLCWFENNSCVHKSSCIGGNNVGSCATCQVSVSGIVALRNAFVLEHVVSNGIPVAYQTSVDTSVGSDYAITTS